MKLTWINTPFLPQAKPWEKAHETDVPSSELFWVHISPRITKAMYINEIPMTYMFWWWFVTDHQTWAYLYNIAIPKYRVILWFSKKRKNRYNSFAVYLSFGLILTPGYFSHWFVESGRETGGGNREREGERLVAFHKCLTGGWTCNPDMCPWSGIEPWPFSA